MVKSSLASLRSIQHKDAYGNPIGTVKRIALDFRCIANSSFPIVDPDRSNPTRNRWERPLDTIRSFEAAIDGGYSNRRSIVRPGTEPSLAPRNDRH